MALNYEVLIPAHEASATIERAIRSAKGQRIPPAQIRVYVDGGTDIAQTEEIAHRAGATDVIISRTNRGVGAARQVLLSRSTSTHVIVLDSDDHFIPNASQALDSLSSHKPKAAVIALGWIPYTANSKAWYLSDSDTVWRPAGLPTSIPLRSHDHASIWKRNPVTSSAALINRQALLEAGGFNPNARRLVDYEAWFQLASRRCSILTGDFPVVIREIRNDSISANVGKAVVRELELTREYAPPETSRLRLAARHSEAWLRGLRRHVDYGFPPEDFPSTRHLRFDGYQLPALFDILRSPFGATLIRSTRLRFRFVS